MLKAINDADVGVDAKLNSTGDGIVLIDTAGGSQKLTVADTQNNNAALDLGIRGESTNVTVGGINRKQIEGSQTYKVTLTGEQSLTQFVDAVNQSNGPITASLLNAGPNSVRVLFTSRASGEIGRVIADGDAVGLNVTTTATARDAVLAVGSTENTGGTIVRSSTNQFDNVVTGFA